MRIYLIGIFSLSFMLIAQAREGFTDYNSLSPEQKNAWGYTVNFSVGQDDYCSRFQLHIPPEAAKYYRGTRLVLRDMQKKTLADINAGLNREPDGSLDISFDLTSVDAHLVIYTLKMPRAEFKMMDCGGFFFDVPAKP